MSEWDWTDDLEQPDTYELKVNAKIDPERVKSIVDRAVYRYVATEIRRAELRENGAIKAAIKDMIYSQKDEIIEKVIERASKEIVRKGLPKLMEKFDE